MNDQIKTPVIYTFLPEKEEILKNEVCGRYTVQHFSQESVELKIRWDIMEDDIRRMKCGLY
jgi:hypothetical protein